MVIDGDGAYGGWGEGDIWNIVIRIGGIIIGGCAYSALFRDGDGGCVEGGGGLSGYPAIVEDAEYD